LFAAIFILLFSHPGHSWDTTHNGFRNQRVMQLRPADAPIEVRRTPVPPPAPRPAVEAPAITVRETPRHIRNPNGGTRQQAITSRGGIAAAQVCGGPIEIRNRQGQCRELDYDRHMLEFIQSQGLQCARSAAQSAFGFVPTRVGLRTFEGQVRTDREVEGTHRISNHAVGRALDVFEVDIYNGNAHSSVRMHRNQMNQRGPRTFYEGFRDCWRREIQRLSGGNISSPCGPSFGCLDHNFNEAHWDHMHISLPQTRAVRTQHNITCT
jgi:hypothetical protein